MRLTCQVNANSVVRPRMVRALVARTKSMNITMTKSTVCFAAQVLTVHVPTVPTRNTSMVAVRINASTVVQLLRGHVQAVHMANTRSKKRLFQRITGDNYGSSQGKSGRSHCRAWKGRCHVFYSERLDQTRTTAHFEWSSRLVSCQQTIWLQALVGKTGGTL